MFVDLYERALKPSKVTQTDKRYPIVAIQVLDQFQMAIGAGKMWTDDKQPLPQELFLNLMRQMHHELDESPQNQFPVNSFMLKVVMKLECEACHKVTWTERSQFGIDLTFGSDE